MFYHSVKLKKYCTVDLLSEVILSTPVQLLEFLRRESDLVIRYLNSHWNELWEKKPKALFQLFDGKFSRDVVMVDLDSIWGPSVDCLVVNLQIYFQINPPFD